MKTSTSIYLGVSTGIGVGLIALMIMEPPVRSEAKQLAIKGLRSIDKSIDWIQDIYEAKHSKSREQKNFQTRDPWSDID